VLYKGKIYAIGGLSGITTLSSVEAYDLHARNWYALPVLPQPTEGAAAVTAMGRIYLIGGAPGDLPFYSTLYMFDGTGWRPGPPMPQATQDYAATRGPDGKIYALGGWNLADLTAVQVFDPAAGTWSLGPPLPGPRCCMGAATTQDGAIYAIGGDNQDRRIAAMHPSVSTTVV
jgi:N-acetylneuraminic acid mutarotase